MDPGTQVMGYGVIMVKGNKMSCLQYGVIHLKKYSSHALKLQKIYERVWGIIEEYLPDEVALEAPFYGQNVQSMLKLGRAQGVAMVAALNHGLPVTEYAPKKVKQSVTGNGNASKEQLAAMLKTLLNLKEIPEYLDATDALGVAITHHFLGGEQTTKSTSWGAFLKANPERQK